MSRSSRISALFALTRCLEEEASAIATAAERLSCDPITVDGDLLVTKALERLEHNRRHQPISVPPVVDRDQRVIGLIRLHNLVQPGLA